MGERGRKEGGAIFSFHPYLSQLAPTSHPVKLVRSQSIEFLLLTWLESKLSINHASQENRYDIDLAP